MTETAEVFDYLVVGGGTAGCVLASRLSEDRATRVALIEAGPRDTHPLIHIPATVGAAISRPALNWRFTTVPQEHLAGRQIPIPRGHVLGGSGSINGMVYFRGHPSDFDDWAAAGNPGWSYTEVLPYFLRSERNDAYPPSAYHGHDGPMNVKFVERPNPMTPAFLAAMQGLGFRRNEDFNGPSTEGYGPRQGTILNGRRVSTATAYLRPASHRRNLTILTGTRAAQILIEQRRAVAVRVLSGAGARDLTARREVIVAAGAVLSPQLLMLSGIGDQEELRAAGIPVSAAPARGGRELPRSPGRGGAHGDEEQRVVRHLVARRAPRPVQPARIRACSAAVRWRAMCSRPPASSAPSRGCRGRTCR